MKLWTVLAPCMFCAAAGCAPDLRLGELSSDAGTTVQGGEVQWARSLAGTGDQQGPNVAVLADGSAVLFGSLQGSVQVNNETIAGVGVENVFWAKINAGGDWLSPLRRFGTFDPQINHGVAVDLNGALLAAGEYSGKVEFGGLPLESTGGRDGYVTKLDEQGNQLWLQPLGGLGNQVGMSVAGDADGGTVVAGYFTGKLALGAQALQSAGGTDAFVARFDASGGLLWAQRFGDGFDQRSTGVAVDGEGKIVVIGDFAGTIDLGAPLVSAGDYDVFVAKLDGNGALSWTKRFGDAERQQARAMAVDGAGNILLGGEFLGTVDFGGGPRTAKGATAAFLAKLGSGGEHIWSRRFGEQSATMGQLVVDGTGSVITTGGFTGQLRLGSQSAMSAGASDSFVAKLDVMGEPQWLRRFGAAGEDRGTGVAVDSSGVAGAMIVAGSFTGMVDFGSEMLDSGGDADVFVVKLGP